MRRITILQDEAPPVSEATVSDAAISDAAISDASISEEARRYLSQSHPRSPHLHLWQDAGATRLLVANGSQLFDVSPAFAQKLATSLEHQQELNCLDQAGITIKPLIDNQTPAEIPLHALSLAVAQKCNLGCTYCYAQQGDFGGDASNMSLDVAKQAIDRLIDQTPAQGRFNLAFMGGEPLINRSVLVAATEYAQHQASARGLTPQFSITSNGTLINAADADFFAQYGFAVTISLDGVGDTHDQLRSYKGGKGSFDRIMRNIRPLLRQQQQQQRMQVSARVTVTPQNLALKSMLDGFLQEGFHSVGFSPLLKAPNGQAEMHDEALAIFLSEMIRCGQEFERRTSNGERYAFANLLNALREINKGTHRPYPCGAGAGYLGVSANGDLYACHRFVNDDAGHLGHVASGIDTARQDTWLQTRHVHRQTPCITCWARYQCGGGCHHEVLGRGRTACDYVRGWLQYCMDVHSRLTRASAAGLAQC